MKPSRGYGRGLKPPQAFESGGRRHRTVLARLRYTGSSLAYTIAGVFGGSLLEIAQPLDGPWATQVRRIAAEVGVTETNYDKIHLFDTFG